MPSRVSLHRTLDHGLPALPLRSAIAKRRAETQPGASEEAYGPNTSVMAPDRAPQAVPFSAFAEGAPACFCR